MRHLSILALIYGALVAYVPLRYGLAGEMAPNLILLAGIVASRHGVGWAALAGLLCDGLAGRPLGVTMLVATLVVTIGRTLMGDRLSPRGAQPVVAMFVSILMIEAGACVLAGTIDATPDPAADLTTSLGVALYTTGGYAMGLLGGAVLRRVRIGSYHDAGATAHAPPRANRF